jgi:UTP--glucose-1-phosphate uridylyltransferase
LPDTPIRTVIIPAAGKGTRLLPATKVTAKELLPIYDRVVLDFAIEEAIGLGAERIVIVISTAKFAIQAYLSGNGVADPSHASPASEGPRRTGPEMIFVFQDHPRGLGHAVLCCKDVTLPGPFAVLLPDDIIFGCNSLAEMATQYTGGHMVAAMQVKPEEASQYGIFRISGLPKDNCFPVSGMVEKPAPGNAPSSIAAVGRYILDPMIFEVLAHTPYGKGGELQLTDAITMSARAAPVAAFKFSGTRYDCGNHDGLLAASVARKDISRQESASGATSETHSDTQSAGVHAILSSGKVLGPFVSPARTTVSVETI